MTLAISQPYFFPYIGYFQLINAADKFIIYDHLHYIKKGWIQRNRIAILNNGDTFIGIPVKKRSSNKRIKELEIDYSTSWQQKTTKIIYDNYRRSPYFEEFYPAIEEIIMQKYESLSSLNYRSIAFIVDLLDIPTPVIYGSDNYLSLEKELEIKNYSHETKCQRIFLICKKEKVDTYINAIGGQKIYDKEVFKEMGVNLFFLKTKEYKYTQQSKEFIPDLSIIDVLFNCGKDKTKQLLNSFELI